jgi:hypothetical protein
MQSGSGSREAGLPIDFVLWPAESRNAVSHALALIYERLVCNRCKRTAMRDREMCLAGLSLTALLLRVPLIVPRGSSFSPLALCTARGLQPFGCRHTMLRAGCGEVVKPQGR